jgi:DNA-binding LacI/PurR family transcriptional regulator
MRVIDELGFQPNFFAQALQSSRSHTIALVAQDITNPFYPALARGVQQAVGSADYVLLLFDAGAGGQLMHAFAAEVVQRRVDGVVFAVGDAEEDLQTFRRAGIPMVAVGSRQFDFDLDWVSADDERLAADAVRHLYGRGHRRIATISGPPGVAPGSTRLAGYRHGIADCGLTPVAELHAIGDWTRDGGAKAMATLLSLSNAPTAVLCANDLMAIGAIDAALAAGRRVPGDVAIVGVDDIDAASLVRPALTTVRIPAQEIGRMAGELLLRRLDGDAGPQARHVLIQHTFVVRDSA